MKTTLSAHAFHRDSLCCNRVVHTRVAIGLCDFCDRLEPTITRDTVSQNCPQRGDRPLIPIRNSLLTHTGRPTPARRAVSFEYFVLVLCPRTVQSVQEV